VGSYLVSLLAELNRTPFDLPEAESELVAGYITEYSSVPFVLYFLGEYASLLLVSLLTGVLWAGGALPPVAALLGVSFVVGVRGTLPRLRYDQLVTFGWLHLLPLTSVALLPVFLAVAL
jgi:NADH-quinone oxidoreductase subunit H